MQYSRGPADARRPCREREASHRGARLRRRQGWGWGWRQPPRAGVSRAIGWFRSQRVVWRVVGGRDARVEAHDGPVGAHLDHPSVVRREELVVPTSWLPPWGCAHRSRRGTRPSGTWRRTSRVAGPQPRRVLGRAQARARARARARVCRSASLHLEKARSSRAPA